MIDLESQVAAFQPQAARTAEQKSAEGTVEDATEASLSTDSRLFLMKQVGLNAAGPSTLFTSGPACGRIKRNTMWASVTLDFLSENRQLGRQAGLTPLRALNRFIQDVQGVAMRPCMWKNP